MEVRRKLEVALFVQSGRDLYLRTILHNTAQYYTVKSGRGIYTEKVSNYYIKRL